VSSIHIVLTDAVRRHRRQKEAPTSEEKTANSGAERENPKPVALRFRLWQCGRG
jgi:hypothetical protein